MRSSVQCSQSESGHIHQNTHRDFLPKTKCNQLLSWSISPENLLRFSAERENMKAATVKTVILCICWANLRHFSTLMPVFEERQTSQEGSVSSCSLKTCKFNIINFKTRSCILLRCESHLLELETLFIKCVSITQVGVWSAFTTHTTTHSIWGHFWCMNHLSVWHVNMRYLLNWQNYSRV